MYLIRIVAASFIVFVLQATFVHRIYVGGAAPDLVLVLLAVLVLDRKPLVAVIIGFLLGFLQDLGNASYLGMNALAKSLLGYGISRFASGYFPDSALFRGLMLFIAAIAGDIIILNITASFNPAGVLLSFFRFSLLSALYTAVTGMAVFAVLGLMPGRVVRPGGGY